MTVTLSEPELLAYLQQFPGARERSFMLRMLALRGLQSASIAGADSQPWPPMPVSTLKRMPEPPPLADSPTFAPEDRSHQPARPIGGQPQASGPIAPPAESASLASKQSANATRTTTDVQFDPLAGLDIAALNDAMDRY